MKLRNYLYATMVACAFASCSNDDDIINGGDDLQGDATLSLKIALPETKAIGTGADNVMNPLTVYVFNGVTDNLEISKIGRAHV